MNHDPSPASAEVPPPQPQPVPEMPPAPPSGVGTPPTLRPRAPVLARCIATGAGSGLAPVAPGTAGTLWAWASYAMLSSWLSASNWVWVIGLSLAVGWWACTRAAEAAGQADPGFIVWDEIVAFWIVLWLLTPASFWIQLAAFVLFRAFDALKPGPVGWADREFKGPGWRGGFGILLDDLVAAGCTLLTLAVAMRLGAWW